MDHGSHAHHHVGDSMDMGSTMNPSMGTDMPMDHDMGGMQMTFRFGYQPEVLFYGWTATTVGAMIGSCIGIFVIAIIYEGLKYFREYLFKQSFASVNYRSVSAPGEAPKVTQSVQRSISNRILSPEHFIQTGLHVLQVAISYFLMLIFMTYNAYLCIAVILGAGVGFFIFGWKKTMVVDVTEHCH